MSFVLDEDSVHDRTHRLAKQLGVDAVATAQLAARKVVLEIDAKTASNPVGKLAFLTLCNLATRLGPYVPNLYIAMPLEATPLESSVYPAGTASLREQAIWTLREAMPTDGLVRRSSEASEAFDLAISIGEPRAATAARVQVGWSGWLALVSDGSGAEPASSDTNPFGALIACAIAVGRLHALQLITAGASIEVPRGVCSLNALTLTGTPGGTSLPSAIRMPGALLVGGGALASAFCYAMTHVPGLLAEVDAVDGDFLKGTNANRQITASFSRAKEENIYKVHDLAAAWAAVRPQPFFYAEFKAERGRDAGSYELAITAVDNAEARREVATDLPKVVIDGATGGLMVAVMRGADPSASCVACAYAEIKSDEDGVWAKRLGCTRDQVRRLREGTEQFDADLIEQIRKHGTLSLDDELERELPRGGWAYLTRARCGNAKPDRELPAASVSYVSAICGFLMAAQTIAEVIGVSTLVKECGWVWEDVLRDPPQTSKFTPPRVVPLCGERHALRSRIYAKKWQAIGGSAA